MQKVPAQKAGILWSLRSLERAWLRWTDPGSSASVTTLRGRIPRLTIRVGNRRCHQAVEPARSPELHRLRLVSPGAYPSRRPREYAELPHSHSSPGGRVSGVLERGRGRPPGAICCLNCKRSPAGTQRKSITLGPARTGVLAVRFWCLPQPSNSNGSFGGFLAVPNVGSPEAIGAGKTILEYQFLRRQQFTFALTLLYTLVALLGLIAWLRDRDQWLLFWMTVFAFTPGIVELFLRSLHISYNGAWLNFAVQVEIQVREVSQWFLLLWILLLHDRKRRCASFALRPSARCWVGSLTGWSSFYMPECCKRSTRSRLPMRF